MNKIERVKQYFILFSIALLTGCAQSTLDETTIVNKSDLELLTEYGFDLENWIEKEEYYLLAPDHIVSKKWLEFVRISPMTRMQWNTNYGKLDKKHQTIYLKDTNIKKFDDLLRQAVTEWNEIPDSNIRFIFNNDADLTVDISGGYDGDMFDAVIIGRPSRTGEYARFVRLNYNKVLPLLADPVQGKYLMMHILGHLAGFAHAIIDPFAMPSDGYIIGTMISDEESIMRSENDILIKGKKWKGFSRGDIHVTQFVYPYIAPVAEISISPAGTGDDGKFLRAGVTYTMTAKYIDAACENPIYSFRIERKDAGPSDYRWENLKNGIIRVVFISTGIYEITATITNAPVAKQINKIIFVPEQEMKLSGPTSVELDKPASLRLECWNPSYPKMDFSLAFEESRFNDPGVVYSIKSKSEGKKNYEITFTKPGDYTITASMLNGPSTKKLNYFVNVYYQPSGYRLQPHTFPDEMQQIRLYDVYFSPTAAQKYNILFRAAVVYDKLYNKELVYKDYVKKADASYFTLPGLQDTVVHITGRGDIRITPHYEITYPENRCWGK